jgi:hypothetical protein
VYRSYPPRPDVPRPDHLLPSAAAKAKRARLAAAQGSSESAEGGSSQAGEGEMRRDNSSEQSVELTDALLPVPQGHRLARKRKAQELETAW